jgi:hypothetical protein
MCRNNLRMIDDVKDQAGLTLNYKMGATVTDEVISPYLRGGFSGLICPKGGRYTIHPLGKESECSEHGSFSAMRASPLSTPGAALKKAADARAAAMQLEAEREGMRLEGVMTAQAAQQANQTKSAADTEAARLEKERQAKLAADAEAARAAVPPPAPPAAPGVQYKLNGIMGGRGNYMALIDNQILKAGDKLGTGKIRGIDATQVTLEAADGTLTSLRTDSDGLSHATQGNAPALPPALRQGLLAHYSFGRDEGNGSSFLRVFRALRGGKNRS